MQRLKKTLYLLILIPVMGLALVIISLNDGMVHVHLGLLQFDISIGGAMILAFVVGGFVGIGINMLSRRGS